MSDFYNNFIFYCSKRNISPSKAAESVGLSRAAPSGWKNGSEPSDANIQKLATFFGCEVADLTRHSRFVPGGISTAKSEGVVLDISKALKQQNPVTESDGSKESTSNELTDYATSLFKQLPIEKKIFLITQMQAELQNLLTRDAPEESD